MYEDLTHALEELDIQPGETRVVQVSDYEVEIRRRVEPESDLADMVMLEPWVEFPRPTTIATLRVEFGELPLPDPPNIPADWEEYES